MSERLKGKNAIITGASNGIGRASALLFAAEGANLVLADVNESDLQQVEKEIKKLGSNVVIRKTDVSSEEEIKALINLALEKFNAIDILVNNAGISGGLDVLEDQKSEEWLKVYEVNVLGPVYATKHIMAHMKERR
jgi:NAD(P)-dependent dehydrogenase (short-subunit alcohol dehydrogenase family)